jgi:solute carrier family 25 (mitochondrial oxoglutarate transporter), member 11
MLEHPDVGLAKYVEEIRNFAIGGTSGIVATTATLPIDYIKVHMQCLSETTPKLRPNPFSFTKKIYLTKGPLEFYSGLSSAITRQAIYGTTRLGLYKTLVDLDKESHQTDSISFSRKFFYSTLSGAIGAFVGNPCDIALIRVQTDHSLPLEKRRNYKGIVDAMIRIPKEEGVAAYWRACTPTVLRACALNFGMLAPYDQCKEMLDKKLGHKAMNRIYASLMAAVCACLVSLPFDNAKVKCQRMVRGPDGEYPYKGFWDCWAKTLKNEGVRGFYVGLEVYVARVGPNVIITLLTLDFLHSIFG